LPTIKLTDKEWGKIKIQIEKDYGKNILLISWRLKTELGFAVRHYRYWKKDNDIGGQYDGYGEYVEEIHLDFIEENSATFFRLKYL